jgi:hypothetical protein
MNQQKKQKWMQDQPKGKHEEGQPQTDKPECQECFDWHGSIKCNFPALHLKKSASA